MKFLSFNYRGFASPPKKLALRRLLTLTQLDIIFLQENLCSTVSLISTLNSWLSNWTFHAMDASGIFAGTAIGFCNKSMELRNLWGGRGFIGMDIFAHSLESEIRIMNVYGPCADRVIFWRSLLDSELLQWVDIPSARIHYTWSNNRSGDQSLARRLDRFLIKEAFLVSHPRIRQRVGTGGISDHRPIFLEVEDTNLRIKSPFKFNASCLKDPSYIQLVSNYWQTNPIMDREDHTDGSIRKLTELKRISRIWAHQKRKNVDNFLREAELAIATYEDTSNGTFLSQETKDLYTSLVTKSSQILKEREESWRLRSREIWLTKGDNNTKFFHKFSNGRKAINTIWELHNEQG
eukprot:PITA_30342